jgi:hypothetical protein
VEKEERAADLEKHPNLMRSFWNNAKKTLVFFAMVEI